MASQYEYSVLTPAAAAAAGYVDMLATTSDAYVREIHFFVTAGTASSVSLFRTTATGTRTTPVVPTAAQASTLGSDANAPLAGFATAWSVVPTLATNALRRFVSGAAIGSGVIWTWYAGSGLRVKAGTSIVLNNTGAAAGSIAAATFVWEE